MNKLFKSVISNKLALVMASIAFAFVITLILDWCIGLLIDVPVNLIFPSRSVAIYSTPEFHIEARINRLGFRGGDVHVRKGKRIRIMTLGDSFTFGWGLDIRDTWPKVLEDELRGRGMDVEVLNLGRPGADPSDYADIADKAIPLLKPDLILIAVNHGDDLEQTMRAEMNATVHENMPSMWRSSKRVIQAMYPNLVGLSRAARGSRSAQMEATGAWRQDVEDLISKLDPKEKRKFDGLDEDIKSKFLKGYLNPAILADSLKCPDGMQRTLELHDGKVQKGIEEISRDILRIKTKAAACQGRVVVISLPNGFFVSREMEETYKRMGFVVEPGDLTTEAMDDAVRQSASKAGVECFGVTALFRKEAVERRLFYPFDGHYNPDGARFFANSIVGFVGRQLASPQRASTAASGVGGD